MTHTGLSNPCICLLKRGHPLNFTEFTSRKDELDLVERLVSEQTAVQDDLNEYISSLLHQVEEDDDNEADLMA